MRIKIDKVILLFSTIFFSLSFSFFALGACPSTPSASLGINTGDSSSLAGLIIHTKNNGTDSNISVTVSENLSENGIEHLNSSYQTISTDDVSSKTWGGGGTYYISGQSTACSDTGYTWLGYGSSNAYGNTWALDCKDNGGTYFTYTVTITDKGAGHYDYSIGGTTHSGDVASTALAANDNNITFKAANGYTGVVTFNWKPSVCGNGTKEEGESCDLGSSNTNACGSGCTTSCSARSTFRAACFARRERRSTPAKNTSTCCE
jgi:hypothetical protein